MISKNFSESEWMCHCGCGQMIIVEKLVNIMQSFRDLIKRPVNVHCVNRCQKHNDSIPGNVKNSLHIQGQACDFHVDNMPIPELHVLVLHLDNLFPGGIGLYDWGCHIDIGEKRSWDNRNK